MYSGKIQERERDRWGGGGGEGKNTPLPPTPPSWKNPVSILIYHTSGRDTEKLRLQYTCTYTYVCAHAH